MSSLVSDICEDNIFYSKVLNELEPCEYFKYYVMQKMHKIHLMIIQGGSLLESLAECSLKSRELAKHVTITSLNSYTKRAL